MRSHLLRLPAILVGVLLLGCERPQEPEASVTPPVPEAPAAPTTRAVAEGELWSGTHVYRASTRGPDSLKAGPLGLHVRLIRDGDQLTGIATILGIDADVSALEGGEATTVQIGGLYDGNEVSWGATMTDMAPESGGAPSLTTTRIKAVEEAGVITGQFKVKWVSEGEPPEQYWGDVRLTRVGGG